jgi:predicted RNA-binding protein with EMAP domain
MKVGDLIRLTEYYAKFNDCEDDVGIIMEIGKESEDGKINEDIIHVLWWTGEIIEMRRHALEVISENR